MFVRLAAVADIPENEVRSFEHAGERIAVYNCNGQWYATDAICTHSYYDLGQGGYIDPDDCTIECPLHGARFDIASGEVRALPAYGALTVYAVKIDGEDVLVELGD